MDSITSARNIAGLEPMGVLRRLAPLCVPMEPSTGFAEETQLRARPRIVSLWERLGLIYLLEQPQAAPVSSTRITVNNFTAQMVFRLCSMNHTDRLIERYQPGFVFPENLRRVSQENVRLARSAELNRLFRSFTENSAYAEEVSRVFRLVFEKESGGIPLQTVCRALAALLGSSGGGAVFTAQQRRIFERIAAVLGTEYPDSQAASAIGSIGAASGFTEEQRRHILEAVGKTGTRPQTDAARTVLRLAELGRTPGEAEAAIRAEVRNYGFIRQNGRSQDTGSLPGGFAKDASNLAGLAVPANPANPAKHIPTADPQHVASPEGVPAAITGTVLPVGREIGVSSLMFREAAGASLDGSVPSGASSDNYRSSEFRRISRLMTGSVERFFAELTAAPERGNAVQPRGTTPQYIPGSTPQLPAKSGAGTIPGSSERIPEHMLSGAAERIFRGSPAGALAEMLSGGPLAPAVLTYPEKQRGSDDEHSVPYAGNSAEIVARAPARKSGSSGSDTAVPGVTGRSYEAYTAYSAERTARMIMEILQGDLSGSIVSKIRVAGAVGRERQKSVTAPSLLRVLAGIGSVSSTDTPISRRQADDKFTSAARETADILRRYSYSSPESYSNSVITANYADHTNSASQHSEQIEKILRTDEISHELSKSAAAPGEPPSSGAVLPAEPGGYGRLPEQPQQLRTEQAPGEPMPRSGAVLPAEPGGYGRLPDQPKQLRTEQAPGEPQPRSGAILPAEPGGYGRLPEQPQQLRTEQAPGEPQLRSGAVLPAEAAQEPSGTIDLFTKQESAADRTREPSSSRHGSYRDRLDRGTLEALDRLISESAPTAGNTAVSATEPESPPELVHGTTERNTVQSDVLRSVSVVRESMVRSTETHMTRLIEKAAKAAQPKTPEVKPFTFRTAEGAENMVMLVPPAEMDRFRAQQPYMGTMPPIELKEPPAVPESAAAVTRTVTNNRAATVRTVIDSGVDGLTRDEISRLADRVYERIETRLTRERRRMGL